MTRTRDALLLGLLLLVTACAQPAFVGPPAPTHRPAPTADHAQVVPGAAEQDAVAVVLPEQLDVADEDDPDGLPPTRLAVQSFSDGMLVVLARTLSTTNVGLGSTVARVLVEDKLAGPALGDTRELTVLAYPGDLVRGRRDLLFLQPFRGGPRWNVERLLDGRDPDFRAKLELTRRTADLLAIRQVSARDAATFELVIDALADARPWMRRYAVAELGWLASTRADLFTDLRRRRLDALAAETDHDEVRLGVESVAIVLARHDQPLPGPSPEESSRP